MDERLRFVARLASEDITECVEMALELLRRDVEELAQTLGNEE